MAICAAMPCWQTSKKRRVDISNHQAIATREDGIEHQLQTSKKRVDISYSLRRHQGIEGRRGHQSRSRHRERKLTSDMADEAIRRRADIEAEELTSAMADEAIKEPDVVITQASSSQCNGFSQLIFPSLGSSFALRHQHQVWQVHRRFLRHLCLPLHLLSVHHAPRPPPARAAHLHCGSCGLLSGIKFHHLLCIFLAIIFPYLHHIEA